MSTLEELKRRKIVQWALAYLAGAWVFAEVADHLADAWGLPELLIQGLHVALAVGLVVTLVLAWYHGEQGRQRVSGPELLILAGIFLVGGVALSALGSDAPPEAANPRLPEEGAARDPGGSSVSARSVAVLPLENHSPDEQYAYFADAMSAEVSTALARVPQLDVKSFASARRFEGSGMTPREFAAELGVAHLLEGSVQRDANRIRITVRLVDARTGEQLWTEVYEKEGVIEAIDVQIDVARQVADQLAAEFSEREFERIEAEMTDDPVAYDAYLQATRYDRSKPEELDLGIEHLRRALERDSTYAMAWANLGGSYDWKLRTTGEPLWRDSALWAFRRAAAHARGTLLENNLEAVVAMLEGRLDEAISLLREDAVAHPGSAFAARDLAFTFWLAGDYDEAIRWMRRYVDLNPLDDVGWVFLGNTYSRLGLDERASRALRRAKDVLDASAPYGWVPYAMHLEHAIRVDDLEAARALADSLRGRRRGDAHWLEASLAIRDGDLERARDILLSIETEEPEGVAYLAYVQRRLGDAEAASRTLEEARRRTAVPDWVNPGFPKLVTTAVDGEPAEVARALSAYVDKGGRDPRWIRVDPVFDRVRDHQDFEAELRRLEEIVARQRRHVERQLAQEDGGP